MLHSTTSLFVHRVFPSYFSPGFLFSLIRCGESGGVLALSDRGIVITQRKINLMNKREPIAS